MSTSSFNTALVIRDAKDNLIVQNDEVDGVRVAHITAALPAGAGTPSLPRPPRARGVTT